MTIANPIRTQALAVRLNAARFFEFTGGDRFEYLHRMVTENMESFGPLESRIACMCTHKGKLVGVGVFSHFQGRLVMMCDSHHGDALQMQLEKYIIMDDVEVEDVSQKWSAYSIQGPQSTRMLSATVEEELNEFSRTGETRMVTLRSGESGIAIAHSRTGEHGIDLWIPMSAASLWEREWENAHTPFSDTTAAVWQEARIEALIAEVPNEMASEVIPVEVGLGHTINYTKGCYAGQEVIAKIKYLGEPPRSLAGFRLDLPVSTLPAEIAIQYEGKEVGKCTSLQVAEDGTRTVGLALLKTRMLPNVPHLTITRGEHVIGEAIPYSVEPLHWGSGLPLGEA